MPQDLKVIIDKAAEKLKDLTPLILSFKDSKINIIAISGADFEIRSSFPKDLSNKLFMAYQESLM